MNLDELQAEIQKTLSTFADLENAFRARLAQIDQWDATEREKERLDRELERVHDRARELLVLRLADLHSELLRVAMLGTG
jgi:chaperonin cofactor prefoldin